MEHTEARGGEAKTGYADCGALASLPTRPYNAPGRTYGAYYS